MHTKTFVIPLDVSVEDIRVGWLWAVNDLSPEVGTVVHEDRPLGDEAGATQYTRKTYSLAGRLPGWISRLLPSNAQFLNEEAWNAFPHCRTVLTHPTIRSLEIVVETDHEPSNTAVPPDAVLLVINPFGHRSTVFKRVSVHVDGLFSGAIERFIIERQAEAFAKTYEHMVVNVDRWRISN